MKINKKLMHNAVMVAVCASTLYLALGITCIGKEANDEKDNSTEVAEVETSVIDIDNEPQNIVVYVEPETSSEIASEEIVADEPKELYTDYEKRLLAKIAMAEAEGEGLEGKALVIRVILNRVADSKFPDSIEKVIFQHDKKTGVYQFSPMKAGGRWWTTEPDQECFDAVELIEKDGWDESQGATYFESKGKSKWHQNHLKFLFKKGSHYFYKAKE